MKTTVVSTLALIAATGMASAGGFDRTGQDISILYEDGDAVKLSFATVSPSVDGTYASSANSGNMAGSYTSFGFAYKQQFNDNIAMALIYDQPYGANVDYGDSTQPETLNSTAELNTRSLKLIGKYSFNQNMSVHAGINAEWLSANISLPGGGQINYAAEAAEDFKAGFIVGAAYEIPDIALRASISYFSEIKHTPTATESSNANLAPPPLGTGLGNPVVGEAEIVMPQSVNIDFQTGIATDTLAFASIRWAEWSKTSVNPPNYAATIGAQTGAPLFEITDNVMSYSLGVGRKFNENLSGSVSLGYEKSNGGTSSNLSPTDGQRSIAVGLRYTVDNVKVAGGVRYVQFGDTTTALTGDSGSFEDNSATAFGLSVTYSF